ncbi:flavodoxin family protein [Oleiharenicola lentus]|uniref:flavodoxin family protein n=1 Tax=Oleiharenicola lentus TaxID=2508720 RepID=UPI003F67757A
MKARRPTILLINASLAGDDGNTAVLMAHARRLLARKATVESLTLAATPDFQAIRSKLETADGFFFGTGTHWDSWSSVLQKFLEDATPSEGTKLWLGKPAAAVVSEHAVGGKGVLSRLQGVLLTLGCAIPSMSGLVISRAALIAAQHDANAARDLWCVDDLRVVCHNLAEASRGGHKWKTWPVDRKDFNARWL